MLKQVGKISDNIQPEKQSLLVSSQDFMSGDYRICVTTLENEVQLNSDSRKTIRNFVLKLFADGLILTPLDKKKTEMDMYRYFKAFEVHGRTSPFSFS